MDEREGKIIFINSHDYVAAGGGNVVGCLAFIHPDKGNDTALMTESMRLQHTLEMAYATNKKVRVSFLPKKVSAVETSGSSKAGFDGPFTLKAIWTLE